jgi:hypothetical protein
MKKLTHSIKGIFVVILLTQLYSTSYSQDAVLKLKDGSYLKGNIINETDQYVHFSILSGDTLFMGYKYIEELLTYREYRRFNPDHAEELEKYHRTEGIFVNVDLWSYPIAVEVGKRLSPSLNAGGRVSFLGDDNTPIIGVESYIQQYLSDVQNKAKFYVEAHAGIGYRTEDRRFFHGGEVNRLPLIAGAAIGVQIPNRKRIKIYFELGVNLVRSVETFTLNDQFFTEITEKNIQTLPQITLIGLQF